ncbi:DNA mismatch repair endonuclease MutL [SAR202 cluster bacterium AD-802-E10_MRT_200m]|nr:DNA mismatch repair endonuclease MutL [SAR202 cluster bacterium AD-802-E10_MRT_200m]
MAIQLLQNDVASMIAAGEVVERPASVVKELIENSLDAGANSLNIEINQSGLGSILVSDNGHGIPFTDTKLLFNRHATSKLVYAEDLQVITSMGFRGEALYSLGSVANVSVLTRNQVDNQGSYLEIAPNADRKQELRGASVGTTIIVRNLFETMPARRKFLKSPKAELSRIQTIIHTYALSHPNVRMTLKSEERNLFASPGTGILQDVASAVYGGTLTSPLINLNAQDNDEVHITGLIGPPGLHRGNRSHVSVFVNKRPIYSRSLLFAITEAFQGFLPVGRYPLAILFIDIKPSEIDVNVHPTKSEIRFRDESLVFRNLQRAVREALITEAPIPQFDMPPIQKPYSVGLQHNPHIINPRKPPDFTLFNIPSTVFDNKIAEQSHGSLDQFPDISVIGQILETYLIAEGIEEIYFVDQHAAHECVLFEKIMQSSDRRFTQSQGTLEPSVVNLSPTQSEMLESRLATFNQYGWVIEDFGKHSYLVRAVPALLKAKNPSVALIEFLDSLLADEKRGTWEEQIAATYACHSAIRAGTSLEIREMEELLILLKSTIQFHTCPHGRPTLIKIPKEQLDRNFLRR